MASKQKTDMTALSTLTFLFFSFGFITCITTSVLVPFFKDAFDLSGFKAQLPNFAFFLAFFCFSYAAGKLAEKLGYKKTLIIALAICTFGCALFYPAAIVGSYAMFLVALFIVGTGVVVIQVAANPFVTEIGPTETATSRLSLVGTANSFATFIAPIFGALVILKGVASSTGMSGIEKLGLIQTQFIYFALAFAAVAIILFLIKLPEIKHEEEVIAEDGSTKTSAWQFPHLILGAIGIFMYVGAEVSVGGLLPDYLEKVMNFAKDTAGLYVALYWGGAMIGRLLGTVMLTDGAKPKMKSLISTCITGILIAFAFCVVAMNLDSIKEGNGIALTSEILNNSLIFVGFTVFNIILFFLGAHKSTKTLMIFALTAAALAIIGANSTGNMAMWPIISIGMFNSIMWPGIFSLALKDLGKYTKQASGILCSMVLGGALVPILLGWLSDIVNIQFAISFVAVCYGYILFFAVKGAKIRK